MLLRIRREPLGAHRRHHLRRTKCSRGKIQPVPPRMIKAAVARESAVRRDVIVLHYFKCFTPFCLVCHCPFHFALQYTCSKYESFPAVYKKSSSPFFFIFLRCWNQPYQLVPAVDHRNPITYHIALIKKRSLVVKVTLTIVLKVIRTVDQPRQVTIALNVSLYKSTNAQAIS